MKVLAKDTKHTGGDTPGFLGVLHTWGRQLQYHPHIHYVVSSGALDRKGSRWIPSKNSFYLPVKALSKIYRAKFKNRMKSLNLFDLIPKEVWKIDWNVNCQSVTPKTDQNCNEKHSLHTKSRPVL